MVIYANLVHFLFVAVDVIKNTMFVHAIPRYLINICSMRGHRRMASRLVYYSLKKYYLTRWHGYWHCKNDHHRRLKESQK